MKINASNSALKVFNKCDKVSSSDIKSKKSGFDKILNTKCMFNKSKTSNNSIFTNMIKDIRTSEKNLNSNISHVIKNKQLSADKLLKLQLVVYNTSLKIEMTSKIADKVNSGIKEVMRIQV